MALGTTTVIAIRVPLDLYHRIVQAAKRDGKKISPWLVPHIEKATTSRLGVMDDARTVPGTGEDHRQ